MGEFAKRQAAQVVLRPAGDGWSEVQVPHWPRVRVRSEELDGRHVVRAVQVEAEAGGLTVDAYRTVSVALIETWLNQDDSQTHRTRVAQRRAVQPPKSRPYPDAFYESVAGVYRELLGDGLKPAPAIAEMADVPVTTVHRWVKESRARGFLPAGRKGRAG